MAGSGIVEGDNNPFEMPSNREWLGIGAAGVGGLLPLLFGGGGGNVGGSIRELEKSTEQSRGVAKEATGQGQDLFRDLLPYIKALAGGDRQELLMATMPERRRVIDQYDTARRSIAEFTPRGGGQAASMNALRGQEAGDLAEIGATARKQGVDQAGQMAQILSGIGLDATKMGDANVKAIADIHQRQAELKAQGWGGLGQALGTIAGFFL